MSINRGTDKEIVVFMQWNISQKFKKKKKRNELLTTIKANFINIMLSKRNQAQDNTHCMGTSCYCKRSQKMVIFREKRIDWK